MRKIIFLMLIAMSSYSIADANFLNLSHVSIGGSGIYSDVDIDGFTFDYTGVSENIAFSGGGGFLDDDYGNDLNFSSFSGRFGINNFDQGTPYIGFSHTDPSEGDSETDIVIGYALVLASDVSYNVSYTDTPDAIIAGSVRYPIDGSNAIQLGLADDGDLRSISIGFSITL
jgi:hypothetical protein